MGSFTVDTTTTPGILALRLEGTFTVTEIEAFAAAHNAAIAALGSEPYRVFVDLRELAPLSPEVAAVMEHAKHFGATRPSFQGSGVLVSSAMVALQHRRTSIAAGLMDTELISDDEAAVRRHLETVRR